MFDQPRFPREALIPLLAGIAWLWPSADGSIVGFLASLVPGCLLLASGTAMLLWPGDHRIDQFAALGAALGILFAIPAFVTGGLATGTWLVAISVASFIASGWASIRQEPHTVEVPEPVPSIRLAAKVAFDEVILSTMQMTTSVPSGDAAQLIAREVLAAREMFENRGWLEKPSSYHQAPPTLEAYALRPARVRGIAYEHLSFESEYEPHLDEPGRDRWLGYERNRTAHAWVVRHEDASRPWLFCVHGYQMGHPLVDLFAFDPRWLSKQLGMNLILPILPLHGPRTQGRRSGDGFIGGVVLDSIHAEAQAMWDMRRMLAWLNAQGATRVGVYGLSLGGYNTALFASLAPGLACAIPGIPATCFTRLVWRHGPQLQVRAFEHKGVARDAVEEILRVVSPLAVDPLVPEEGRAIFGAVADRLVPADQVRDLWKHWRRPEMLWYQGSHMSIAREPEVRAFVEKALRRSGLVPA